MQYTILPNMTGRPAQFSPVPKKGKFNSYEWINDIPATGMALVLLDKKMGRKQVEATRRAIQTASRNRGLSRNTSRVGDLLTVW